ncbi:MAG: homocysteine S-methyltransferase family protein [Pseudomonadota bacterium]
MAKITMLDGGMGRELKRIGAPFGQPEWSALALMEAPEKVLEAHNNFLASGSDIITTNAYAVVPFHIGEAAFKARGAELIALAGSLAREAAAAAGRPVKVAGSLPPVLGSYNPEGFDTTVAGPVIDVLIENQRAYVDCWLIETTSSVDEALFTLSKLAEEDKPVWLSLTLTDREDDDAPCTLRSGEPVEEAIAKVVDVVDIDALLFNCSPPEEMETAITIARSIAKSRGVELKIGAYANAFTRIAKGHKANETVTDLREELTPERYASFAEKWAAAGATLIGGCCGIGPDHIKCMRTAFEE